jgi:hypothetical protein
LSIGAWAVGNCSVLIAAAAPRSLSAIHSVRPHGSLRI